MGFVRLIGKARAGKETRTAKERNHESLVRGIDDRLRTESAESKDRVIMDRREYRTSAFAYRVLAIPWFVIAILCSMAELAMPGRNIWQAILIAGGIGLLVCAGLAGYRLTIEGDTLSYRNGLFRRYRGSITQIRSIRRGGATWDARLERLIVRFNDGGHIAIDPMPFGSDAHAALARLKPIRKPTKQT